MKRSAVFFLLATFAFSCLCSCDFIRTLAGRPSSEAIEQLRSSEKQKLEEQAAARAADSLQKTAAAAYDAFVAEGMKIRNSSQIPTFIGQAPDNGLYLALGTFSLESNANKLCSQVSACGYDAGCLAYANGFFLVVTMKSDDYNKLREGYLRIKNEKFFPADAWILEYE